MSAPEEPKRSRSASEIQDWLVSQIADLLEIQAHEIDVTKPFKYYGLNSAEAAILSVDLQSWLGFTVPPTLAWDYPTVEATARYLAEESHVRDSEVANLDRTAENS